MTKVSDYRLDTGDDVEVTVDTGGHFHAQFKGKDVVADTLDKLLAALNRRAKEKRVRVGVLVGLDDYQQSNVTLTGIKANKSDEALVRDDKGKPDTVSSYQKAYVPWTDASRAEYRALLAAQQAANRAVDEFKKAHLFDRGKGFGLALSEVVEKETKRLLAERDAAERKAAS